jgi:tetraacyldisaccharide 4'-kinase
LCVVSVGNLEVGGSGKTPLAMHLVADIAAAGGRPVYVSRGFGGIAERIDIVTVVPGDSDEVPITRHAGVRGLRRGMAGLSAEVGDEGAMVARRLPEVPLLFCRDKWRALDIAAKTLNPTHAVMDDAFQSWGVPRDIDIVLVDGGRPIGDGWLLPAGRLREPVEALERADIVGVTGVEDEEDLAGARESITRATGDRKPAFGIRRRIDVVWNRDEKGEIGSDSYAALSAIGQPELFEAHLARERQGLALSFRYPDHHKYQASDLDWVAREAERRGIDSVVTTEKDWSKLSDLVPRGGLFGVARLTLELFGEDPLAHILKKAAD